MYSHVTLHLLATSKEILSLNGLPAFCSLVLQDAEAVLFTIPSGQVLLQSIQHYLVNIELYEYEITQNTKIDLTITKATFFMLIMLSGHSILSDEDGNVLTETHGNCCYISYAEAGQYARTFLAGQHKMLLLTINPDFMMQQSERLQELQPALKNYLFKENKYFSLVQSPIAKCIFKALKRLNARQNLNPKYLDKKKLSFLNECLNNYNKNLALRQINNTAQFDKAEEIANFIHENFRSQVVNNKAKLAGTFCITEKTMLRLAKKKFGRPLHQKVIELRMLYSLKQFESTAKTVKEVTQLVGYNDPYYFSRIFKHHFGVSPSNVDRLGESHL
jgi:AraC-like DNA-binding protein